MNSRNLIIVAHLFFACFIMSFNANAQCDDEDFLDECAEILDDYTFAKSFDIELEGKGKTNKVEYSYVFSKDHTYILTVCDMEEAGNKLIINLYDRNKKLITSSNKDGSFKEKIGYRCSATGVYYIEAYFENFNKGCGISILGFNK